MYENDCNVQYRLNDDGTYSVTGTGYGTTLNIPATHNGLPVTSVCDYSFRFCPDLEIAVIGNLITLIGNSSFCGCPIKSVIIGKNVERIGENSFAKCPSIADITVSEGNEKYFSAGDCLIEIQSKTLILGCRNSVIPADGSVTAIGQGAFQDCAELESVIIPDGVTRIDNLAFNGCPALKSVFLGKGVNSIGNGAFAGCASLEKIRVKHGNAAYYGEGNCLIAAASKTLVAGCRKSVIPDGVKIIGRGAFQGCNSLKSVNIPDGVEAVGDYAFYGCTAVKAISFGTGVAEIDENAFCGCTSVQSIAVAEGNEKYHCAGNCLIETQRRTLVLGCVNSVIPDDGSVTAIGRGAFYGCASIDITVPNGVISIGDYAFYGCNNLESITLPASIRSVGNNVFLNCLSLKKIIFEGTADEWAEIKKDENWNFGTGNFTVCCAGADLDKYENEIKRSA